VAKVAWGCQGSKIPSPEHSATKNFFKMPTNFSCQIFDHGHDGFIDSNEYANEWVVHLENEDEATARLFALKKDYEYVGEVSVYRKYTLDKVSSILFCISVGLMDLKILLFFPFPIGNDVL